MNARGPVVALLAVSFIHSGLAAAARAEEDPHAACARMGWVPREILERPLPLREGLGNAHDAVTTSSREAQAFYDQGVNYLHGYVWIEAARSFRQALRLDPKLAMAWLGLSRVSSGLDDPEEAKRAQAEALAADASPREPRRIVTRAAQLAALADLADAAGWPRASLRLATTPSAMQACWRPRASGDRGFS